MAAYANIRRQGLEVQPDLVQIKVRGEWISSKEIEFIYGKN